MTLNTNIPDIRLRNFVIDQIKKHLALYNFSEVDPDVFEQVLNAPQEIGLLTKFFAYDTRQNSNQISMQILNPALNSDKIIPVAYLIKILDTLFAEVFKIENYALKIGFKSSPESEQEFEELTKLLQILSVSYVIDTNLTSKLDNQSGIAFEFVSRSLGSTTAPAGGIFAQGSDYEINEKIHGATTSFDINQLVVLVQHYQNRLLIPEKPALHVIIPINKEQITLALLLADILRANSLSTDVILESSQIASQVSTATSPSTILSTSTGLLAMMQKANKLGAKYVLIIGPDEQNGGTVMVKNMQKNESFSVKQTDIISYLK